MLAGLLIVGLITGTPMVGLMLLDCGDWLTCGGVDADMDGALDAPRSDAKY